MSRQSPDKVTVEVMKRDQQFFADVGFNNTIHSLGPASSRDEIYGLIFGFISDLRLVAELDSKRKAS